MRGLISASEFDNDSCALLGSDIDGSDIDLDAYARRVVAAQWAPRDEAAAVRFVRDRLPAGRVMIYGAGTHTARLINALTDRPDVTILAVLDRHASGDGDFLGYPLRPPQSASATEVDHVVVAHPVWETDMIAALSDRGAPMEKLFRTYSNPAYLAEVLAPARAAVRAGVNGGVCNVIIGSAKWAIISDAELAEALPPDKTVKLHFDLADPFAASPVYHTIDLQRSYALLQEAIREIRPTTIYLRTHTATNLLGHVVRGMAPKSRLIHEMYDFACLLSDRMLFDWMGMSPEDVAGCRAAEQYSMRRSDLIVSKRAGRSWRPLLRQFTAPYRVFYGGKPPPALPGPSPRLPSSDRPIRILYAGILPKPEHLDISLSDYNFLPLLEDLAATGRFEIALYNYMHDGEAMDHLYGGYLRRFSTPALRYHRCVAYETLVRLAADFDYGWLYRDAAQEENPDVRIVVGQRFTGYVFAGLPLILDEGWESMVDLVHRHRAGLVIKAEDRDRLAEIIADADHPALVDGVRDLRAAITAHNQTVLRDIAAL